MVEHDMELARRVRDIVVVVADDIDNVTFEVEDGVAYIEGVVSSDGERRAISHAVAELDGLDRVVTCLATEHVHSSASNKEVPSLYPTQLYMHYYAQG